MPRFWLMLVVLLAAGTISSGGCRSCSSCHDYDPPVAACDCSASGCHRAGSAAGGYVSEGYPAGEYEYVVEPPIDESTTDRGGATGSR